MAWGVPEVVGGSAVGLGVPENGVVVRPGMGVTDAVAEIAVAVTVIVWEAEAVGEGVTWADGTIVANGSAVAVPLTELDGVAETALVMVGLILVSGMTVAVAVGVMETTGVPEVTSTATDFTEVGVGFDTRTGSCSG